MTTPITPHGFMRFGQARTAIGVALLAVWSTLAACASRPSTMDRLAAEPAVPYRGHYTLASGSSWFRPCELAAADSAWWVLATGTAASQIATARREGRLPSGQRVYVEWRGAVTRTGEIGPRGPGAPALVVRSIEMLRAPTTNDCR
jgi:hypothetical protein